MQQFGKLALGLLSPMPGVLERGDLRVRLMTFRRLEQQVVIAFGIERRIEVDQVNRRVADVRAHAERVEVVAKVERVRLVR